MGFGGFWCRNCGGRVFQDEPYKDGHGKWMAVLTCLLCAKEHQCSLKDYKHLLEEIERVILQRAKNKNPQKQVLHV
jgi:hypothetical protein